MTPAPSFRNELLRRRSALQQQPIAWACSSPHTTVTISPETALHRLRRLYRDAHHCEAPTDQHAIDWAKAPELWAEHQIRFRGWGFIVTESTVREARKLYNRIHAANLPLQQEEPAA